MNFNDEQKAVLSSKLGVNVAVAAGAGAGKSTVLVEKLIGHIVNDGLDPENILVVTFTNDAANSVRAKIKNKIRGIPSLKHLVPKVDAAHIETTDAFRLYLVTKYAKALGIKGTISNVGSDILRIEQNKYLNNYFDNIKYNPLLVEFARDYLRNTEEDICDFIVAISNLVDLKKYPTKEEYVESTLKEFTSDEYLDRLFEAYLNTAIDETYLEEKYQEAYDAYSNLVNDKKACAFFETKFQYFDGAKTKKDYYKAISFFIEDKSVNCVGFKRSEEATIIKNVANELKEIPYVSFDEYKKVDLPNLRKYLPIFLDIAYDLAKHIDDFKVLHGAYTFTDIENMSNYLVTIPEIANEIKKSFKIIMIDEYQDTSDVQNEFYNHISDNNLFLVGDIKQSIYGFRGANPQNFANKLCEISESHGELYHMNYNYRSRKEVIDKINELFTNYMDVDFGGVNYKNGEALKKMEPQPPFDKTKGLFILPKVTTDYTDQYIKEHSINVNAPVNNAFLEVLSIGLNICARIEDAKNNNTKLDYSSFAILTRTGTNFDLYRAVFGPLGIPVNILKEEDITDSEMVKVIISFIKLVNLLQKGNNEQNEQAIKFYLTSMLRSYVFNYDDQTIYEAIVNNKYLKMDVYTELLKFSENHLISSIYDIVTDMVSEFKIIDKLSTIYNDNAINSITKLNFLLNKIKEMDSVGYSLDDLVYYLENMDKLKISLAVNIGKEALNAVTIQTIHGSKGLEYDIVYVADEEKSLKGGDNTVNSRIQYPPYYVSKKNGFAFPRISINGVKKSSIVSQIASLINSIDVISEETRLFYVALTRAKNICILPFNLNDDKYKAPRRKEGTDKYRDIVTLSGINIPADKFGCPNYFIETNSDYQDKKENPSYYDNPNSYIEIERKKASLVVDNSISNFILRRGTHYHLLMQAIDFNNIDTSFIKNDKDRQNIERVLNNPIFDNVKNATQYKEYHYFDSDTNSEGVIDLLLIYEDKAIIVDYKLKNVDESKYQSQLDAYKAYVSKTFGLPTECHLLALINNGGNENERN